MCFFHHNEINEHWSPEVEETFDHILLDFLDTTNLYDGFKADMVMPDIAKEMYDALEDFLISEVRQQFFNLKECYDTFKYIINQLDVEFDKSRNLMLVPHCYRVSIAQIFSYNSVIFCFCILFVIIYFYFTYVGLIAIAFSTFLFIYCIYV